MVRQAALRESGHFLDALLLPGMPQNENVRDRSSRIWDRTFMAFLRNHCFQEAAEEEAVPFLQGEQASWCW